MFSLQKLKLITVPSLARGFKKSPPMNVILTKDHGKSYTGELIKVRKGYFRHFLQPQV